MNDLLIVAGYFAVGMIAGIFVTIKEDAFDGMLVFFLWPVALPLLIAMRFFMWIEDRT